MPKRTLTLGTRPPYTDFTMSKDSLSVPLPARRLHHARFRRLWTANLVSNLGTWIQTFASAWLIASPSHWPPANKESHSNRRLKNAAAVVSYRYCYSD